jgi:hypothetical protein
MNSNTKAKGAAETGSNAWIPTTPGAQLVGELTDIDTVWSDYRESEYPLLTIRDDAGDEWMAHCFRTVLYREILKWKPEVGERVTVTYRGPGKAKSGMSPAEIYRVQVQGRASAAAKDVYRRLERRPEPPVEPDVPIDAPAADDEPLSF